MNKPDIRSLLAERILVLDGAMGTMIQRYALEESDFRGTLFVDHTHSQKGNNDLLCLTRPDIIREIHDQYLEAGSDILETNTFNANAISMHDYGMENQVYAINRAAAEIASAAVSAYTRRTPGRPRYVAGAIGPTNRIATGKSTDTHTHADKRVTFQAVGFNELREAYRRQVEGLRDGGVDLLLIETVFNTLNARAVLDAIDEVFRNSPHQLPVIISGVVTQGREHMVAGVPPDEFSEEIAHSALISLGMNCTEATTMLPNLERWQRSAAGYLAAFPSAGIPDRHGVYPVTSTEFAAQCEALLNHRQVRLAGGCCGTTPEHIRALAVRVKAIAGNTG